MSNIWHITNQNGKPTDIPEKENFIILDGVLGNSGLWYGGEEPIIFWENVKRWCYLDELILESERTRKALDVAVDALKELKPQKAKGGGYWAVKSADAIKLINTTIKQITALEQKD